jgi:low temperature requirement protein LtrA
MVSRLTLAIEYGTIAWHVRKFKNANLGLYIQIGLCLAAAVTYLGVAFRFTDGNSRIFITWYVVGVLEVLLTFLLSAYSLVMSFTRTHLMKRLTFLTVIILGDGIVIMAEKILVIVKAPDPWGKHHNAGCYIAILTSLQTA